jgi:hypothetical protein
MKRFLTLCLVLFQTSAFANDVRLLQQKVESLQEQRRLVDKALEKTPTQADFIRLLVGKNAPGNCRMNLQTAGDKTVFSIRNENGAEYDFTVISEQRPLTYGIGGEKVYISRQAQTMSMATNLNSPNAKATLSISVKFNFAGELILLSVDDEDEHENRPNDVYFSAWCESK